MAGPFCMPIPWQDGLVVQKKGMQQLGRQWLRVWVAHNGEISIIWPIWNLQKPHLLSMSKLKTDTAAYMY